jgi:hypothetical protein
VQDLTEQGISIQAAEPLVPLRAVSLLPGTTQVVHATGDFIWTDGEGRAGLFFQDIPAACRRDLNAWLKNMAPSRPSRFRCCLNRKGRAGQWQLLTDASRSPANFPRSTKIEAAGS